MTYGKDTLELSHYFPALLEIQDSKAADAVAAVWMKALDLSDWRSLGEVPFTDKPDGPTLVAHVNSATECVLALADIIAKNHGKVFDRDRILILGLLHDVDKVVKYKSETGMDGRLVLSELGRKISHGIFTAMLARDAGFDTDMQHLILTHTHHQEMRPAFKEGVLFQYADLCDWEMASKY